MISNHSKSSIESGSNKMSQFHFDFAKKATDTDNKDNKDNKQQFKFDFNIAGNSTGTNQPASTTPSTFSFSLGPKLTFNFGTGVEFQAEKKEFGQQGCFGTFKPFQFQGFNAQSQKQEEEEPKADDIENPICESEETGEEGEDCLLDTQAAMYQLVKEVPKKEDAQKKDESEEAPKPRWAERGAGSLHLNYVKEHKFYRLILRRNPLKTIILNQRVFKGMSPKKLNKNSVQILGTYLSTEKHVSDSEGKASIDILLFRFKDQTVTDKFMELLDKAIKECE